MRIGVIQIKHGDSDLPHVNIISNQINTLETNLREEIYLDCAVSKRLCLDIYSSHYIHLCRVPSPCLILTPNP